MKNMFVWCAAEPLWERMMLRYFKARLDKCLCHWVTSHQLTTLCIV